MSSWLPIRSSDVLGGPKSLPRTSYDFLGSQEDGWWGTGGGGRGTGDGDASALARLLARCALVRQRALSLAKLAN